MWKGFARHSAFANYSLSLLVTAAAAVLTILVSPVAELRPYYFFVASAAVATWFGGFAPGIVAAVLGSVGAGFLVPRNRIALLTFSVHYIGFLCVTALVVALIAQRRSARSSLRGSNSKFEGMVQISDDAIMMIDEQQRITLFNPAAERIFGYTAAEVLHQPLDLLLPERYRAMHAAHVKGFNTSPEALRSMNRRGIIFGLRKGGEEFPAEASISKFDTDEGRVMTVRLRDISERQKLEEQLRQSQKMEAVGRLAGGVAHDFNNLLGVIVGNMYLLKANPRDPAEVKAAAEQVIAAAEKAGALTRQLLAFSRKQVMRPEIIDLNRVTENLGKMIPRLVGEDVDVRILHGKNLKPVKADPNQLEQVIMNLVVNARDAMPRGGKLTIETNNVSLNAEEARRNDVQPGNFVLLAVSDTGSGMDEATRSRIFEPFFTTKPTGKGTGLGLATVYGIVRQSNGYIWVYSEAGQGTTFKVYLPASADTPSEVGVSEAPEIAASGTETIMLVEDEDALREVLVKVLKANGYHVLSSSRGPQALDFARLHREPIHLLVSDVILPDMRGPELAAHLSRLHPEVRVLYMSGFTDNALMHSGSLPQSTLFLQKPFTPDVLLRRVRDILDEGLLHERSSSERAV
jgi:two-component system cell cycle sensor histidine kinase/response regulator CckA